MIDEDGNGMLVDWDYSRLREISVLWRTVGMRDFHLLNQLIGLHSRAPGNSFLLPAYGTLPSVISTKTTSSRFCMLWYGSLSYT